MPVREQVPRESYRRGDRVRAFILDVLYETRGPQIVLSRTHPTFLVSLFKTEVPEISEGIVDIMGAAREPGSRSKIAVASNDSDIDPVGACVGMKGSRVQSVVQELRGEKIDIISWHADAAKYVCNALAPAEISRVIIDEENRSMEVIVPDENLSIAIGKKGQNVRLASKLSGWHLDVNSETKYSQAMKDGYDSLMALPGVGISMADALYEKGFFSAEELSKARVEELTTIRGIGDGRALKLIEIAADELVEARARAAQKAAEPPAEKPQKDADQVAEADKVDNDAQASSPAEAPAEASEEDVLQEEDEQKKDESPDDAATAETK